MPAPDTITITVTAQDIKDGEKCGAHSCPIALAVSRTLELEPWQIEVTNSRIRLRGDETTTGPYWLNREAERFIRRYDLSGPVRPFTFTAHLA